MNQFIKLMKIFEVMWLVAAVISLYMAISRSMRGESYGSYIYITIFTAAVALFMWRFKRKNRRYLERHYGKKQNAGDKREDAGPGAGKNA
ncbi:MAG: hypothetical protein R2794_08865 [Chitinophagales bacterium]